MLIFSFSSVRPWRRTAVSASLAVRCVQCCVAWWKGEMGDEPGGRDTGNRWAMWKRICEIPRNTRNLSEMVVSHKFLESQLYYDTTQLYVLWSRSPQKQLGSIIPDAILQPTSAKWSLLRWAQYGPIDSGKLSSSFQWDWSYKGMPRISELLWEFLVPNLCFSCLLLV